VGQDPSEHPAQSSGVRDWLAAVAASQSELGGFLEDVFDRISGLLGEFCRHQQAWESDRDRDRAKRDLQARSDELTHRETALRTPREPFGEAAAARVGSPATAASPQEELIRMMIAELQEEREALRVTVAAAEMRGGGWGHAAPGVANARDALLPPARADDRYAEPPFQAESRRGIETRMHRHGEELAQLERERAALAREVEIVRSVAELSETLSQQGRQMAEQREQWSDEITRMRGLLETVAQRQLAQPEAEPRLTACGGA
jgi:hypothetical protein